MDQSRQRKNPNIFGQLRSLTILLTKEPPHLQQLLDNPPPFDDDTARLVLKETQRDVKKLAGEARGHLAGMQESAADFNNLLDACGKLVAKKKETMERIEQHLQKYGYTPYRAANSTSNRKAGSDSEDKENQPEPEESGDTLRNSPSTANDRLDKMPSLAEFGISQSTLAFLNKRGSRDEIDSRTQVFKHPIIPGKKMGKSDDLVTPFDQESGVLVTPGIGLRMCESPFCMTGADQFASPAPPVFTTPRLKEMFNSNKKRHPSMDETFVVKSSPHLTNPELPNFLTPSLQRYSRKQNQESCVPKMECLGLSPGAPQMSSSRDGLAVPESPKIFACRSGAGVSTQVSSTRYQESASLQRPQDQSHYSSQVMDNLVNPDTPEMTCNFRFRNMNLSEKPPVPAPTQNTSPEHLTSAIPDSQAAPVTPAAFNVNPTPPESMKKYNNNDVVMPTPPRFYTETARRMFCDAELDNIPTPEVVMPDPRAEVAVPSPKLPRQQGTSGLHEINEVAAPCHVEQKDCDVGQLNLGPGGRKRVLPKRIAFITQDEYDQQPDYLQNTVSLETINKCIHKVNTFIRDKSEAGCGEDILSAELQNELGFGNHAKKLILLLLQVKRISQQKVGVYAIVD
ncbi:uncharacterized protein LOC135488402 [Lineus longissimus]|uniref:uncharacterized protein LOC135488402 n=1 Tax=Lineus longissimus TaxID=88925 RepID=UPI002B4E48A5